MEKTAEELIDEEEWRPVSGYEGLYEISNLGRLRSYHRLKQGSDPRIIKLSPGTGTGYPIAILSTTNSDGVRIKKTMYTFLRSKSRSCSLPIIDSKFLQM